MTQRTVPPPVPVPPDAAPRRAPAVPAPRAVPGDAGDGWSQRGAALTGGVALLLMAALAGFGYVAAVEPLWTDGDAARTAADVAASEGLFRAGVASLLAVVILDVVAACALYRVLAPVSRAASAVAAAFRLTYTAAFLVAIGFLVQAVGLFDRGEAVAGLRAIESYDSVWHAALLLFGVHLAIAGRLAYRSGFVPRSIGVLLVVAGAGYAVDTFGMVLTDSWTDVSTVTFVGEFLLAVWLVVRGRRLPGSAA